MVNNRTDKTLDALAELYLTAYPKPKTPEKPNVTPHTPHPTPPPTHTPAYTPTPLTSTSTQNASAGLDGPQPIRLRPKPPTPPHPTHPPTTTPHLRLHHAPTPIDPQSAFTDSRHTIKNQKPAPPHTHQAPPPTHTTPHTPAPIRVELVLLGNLPGFGGPWLTQYAHQLTVSDPQHRPVVVLRVDHDQIELDLIQAFHDRHDHDQSDSIDLIEQLEQATQNDDDGSSTTLLGTLDVLTRPDEPWASTRILVAAASLPRHDLLQIAAILNRWTLLTGADEAALAAAGQLLSQLTHAVEQQPELSAVVMGSQPQAAADMTQRLAKQIEQPIRLAGAQPRMEPVNVRELMTLPQPMAIWPDVAAYLNEIDTADVADTPTPEPVVEPITEITPEPTQKSVHESAPPIVAKPTTPHRETQNLQPQFVAEKPEIKNQKSEIPDMPLVTHLQSTESGAGALAIDARCPRHPDVQIAVDPDGRVRLLGYESDESAVSATLVELIETRTWVIEHAQLLAMTQRQIQFDTTQPPALHLFTPAAKQAAAMTHQLADVIHIHLLVPVTIGPHTNWYTAELN